MSPAGCSAAAQKRRAGLLALGLQISLALPDQYIATAGDRRGIMRAGGKACLGAQKRQADP